MLRTVPIRHFRHNLHRPQLPSPVPIPSAVGTRLPPHCPFPLSHSPLFPICTPLCLHLISLFSPPSLVPSVDIVPNSDTLCYNDPHYVTVPCLALFTRSIYTLAACHVNSVQISRILSLHLLCLKISDLTSLTSVTFDTFRPPSSVVNDNFVRRPLPSEIGHLDFARAQCKYVEAKSVIPKPSTPEPELPLSLPPSDLSSVASGNRSVTVYLNYKLASRNVEYELPPSTNTKL